MKPRRLRSSSEMHHVAKETKAKHVGRTGKNGSIRISDGEWLKMRYDGTTKCVIVHFPFKLSYREIRDRMKRGFDDLDGREVIK